MSLPFLIESPIRKADWWLSDKLIDQSYNILFRILYLADSKDYQYLNIKKEQ